jgi:MFS family permease
MASFSKLMHNRSLVIIGASETVSNVGNWITMMAVFAMLVFKGNGGVVQSSGVFLAGLIPTLLVSPFAGWLLDRFDRKHLMITSELFSGLIILGLVFTSNLALIYAILALQAVSISIMTPARQAVVPDLVSREDLTRANAFFQQLAGSIKIVAPMLAGLILAVINPHLAVVLDVISFGLSALILSRLPSLLPHLETDERDVSPQAKGPTGIPEPEVGASLLANRQARANPKLPQLMKEAPRLRLLFIMTFLVIMVIVSYDVLAPVYVKNILGAGEQLFGTLIGLIGVGTLAASILLMIHKGEQKPWRDVILGGVFLAFVPGSMAAAGFISDPGLALGLTLLGSLVGGFGNGLVVIQAGTLLQLLTPPGLLGRISGVFQSTAVAGQLVGIVLTPVLVPALFSMPFYFMVAAAALLLVILYALLILSSPSKSLTASHQPSGD